MYQLLRDNAWQNLPYRHTVKFTRKSPSAYSGHLYTKSWMNYTSMSQFCHGAGKCLYNTIQKFPSSAKDLYRQQYFKALDFVANCVQDHFKQPGYQLYHHLEDVLLKCMHGDKSYQEDIEFISKFYSGDLENSSLSTHLETFTMLVRNNHWSR